VFLLDLPEVVVASLVAESAAPAVDQHDDSVFFEPVLVGDLLAEHVRDALHLEEVVPRAERPHLVASSVHRLLGDVLGAGVGPSPLVLTAREVAFDSVPLFDGPLDAPF